MTWSSKRWARFASLTVHCARCHEHKYDPIPQKDYYQLEAVFSGVERRNRIVSDPAAAPRAAIEKRRAEIALGLPAGWSSAIAPMEDMSKWVQIDLGSSMPLTEIRPRRGAPARFRKGWLRLSAALHGRGQ